MHFKALILQGAYSFNVLGINWTFKGATWKTKVSADSGSYHHMDLEEIHYNYICFISILNLYLFIIKSSVRMLPFITSCILNFRFLCLHLFYCNSSFIYFLNCQVYLIWGQQGMTGRWILLLLLLLWRRQHWIFIVKFQIGSFIQFCRTDKMTYVVVAVVVVKKVLV